MHLRDVVQQSHGQPLHPPHADKVQLTLNSVRNIDDRFL